VSVPGCVRAWAMLLERFGAGPSANSWPRRFTTQSGLPARIWYQAAQESAPRFDDPEWHSHLPPRRPGAGAGELLVQADLARTLRDLALEAGSLLPGPHRPGHCGTARRRGFVTPAISPGMPASGTPRFRPPIAVTVHETPPPTQGLAALIGLNLLEGFPSPAIPCICPSTCICSSRWPSSPTPTATAGSATPRMPPSRWRRSSPRPTRRNGGAPSIPGRPRPTRPAIPAGTPRASSSPTGGAT
jgi:hypothetical protein